MAGKTDTLARKKDPRAGQAPKRSVDAGSGLTPQEAKLVRRGEAQLKKGQSKSWRDVKDALAR